MERKGLGIEVLTYGFEWPKTGGSFYWDLQRGAAKNHGFACSYQSLAVFALHPHLAARKALAEPILDPF